MSIEFLAVIDQQKAFLKRNDMPSVAMQFLLCNKQSKCKITLKGWYQGHLHLQEKFPSKLWKMLQQIFLLRIH